MLRKLDGGWNGITQAGGGPWWFPRQSSSSDNPQGSAVGPVNICRTSALGKLNYCRYLSMDPHSPKISTVLAEHLYNELPNSWWTNTPAYGSKNGHLATVTDKQHSCVGLHRLNYWDVSFQPWSLILSNRLESDQNSFMNNNNTTWLSNVHRVEQCRLGHDVIHTLVWDNLLST